MSRQVRKRAGWVMICLAWSALGPAAGVALAQDELAPSSISQPARGEDGEGAQGEDRAQAEAVREAERYAEQAFAAYQRGDAALAIVLYKRAYRAAPSADILYNLARIYDRNLGHRPNAIKYYEGYMADPDADPERVVEARTRLETLRELQDAGPQPSAPASSAGPDVGLTVMQGQAGGERTGAALSAMQVGGLVTGGLGLVALGVSGGFGYLANRRFRDADCDGNLCRTGDDVEMVNDARHQAMVSTVAGIGGLVLVAAGTALYLLGGADEEASVQLAPLSSAGLSGSRLTVRW